MRSSATRRHRRKRHALVGMRQAGGNGRAATGGRGVGEFEGRHGAGHVEGDLDPAAGERRIVSSASVAPALTHGVAPSSRAKASFSSERSTATIWRAPATFAPSTALRPTPPRPTTATDAPGSTRAVLTTAPTPGQHRAAEQSRKLERQVGIDLDAGFARDDCVFGKGRDAEMVVDRLGAEARAAARPTSSVPAPLALAPGSQKEGRPAAQGPQRPQLGTKTSTT